MRDNGHVSRFTRFIAFGDSITEGLCDDIVAGQYVGWADRVAYVLAHEQTGFEYFNLAVRGKRLEQVVADQIPLGIEFIEGSQTLVSFHAGANNILRPGYEPDVIFSMYQETVRRLAATGAQVMLFTVQEVADPQTRTQRLWNSRFGGFNNMVRKTANEVGALLLDGNTHEVFFDKRLIAPDRLHLNADGHRRVASAVLANLGMPHDSDWDVPIGPMSEPGLVARCGSTIRWITSFLIPWALRRMTGKSSGDGRVAKHTGPVVPS